jgi:pSer/pThr/pTyr-binding forkhead associated (FHA) protein
MADVVVELEGQEVVRVPLVHPNTIIGRDQTADVYLENRALSRKHAQLEKRGAGFWIRDLESQNGTYVNGEKILEPMPLSSDDAIQLGRYDLYIEGVKEASADTVVFTVTNLEGKQRYALVGNEIIVGRSPTCDIPISYKGISRRHFKLSSEGTQWFIEDLGSQNGTRLNGSIIDGQTPFNVDDSVQISEYTFELSILQTELTNVDGDASEANNKTMMLDPEGTANVADLGGDFDLASAESPVSIGDSSMRNADEDGPEFEDDEISQTKGLQDFVKGIAKGITAPAHLGFAKEKHCIQWDVAQESQELILQDAAVAIGENGERGEPNADAGFADQAYLLFAPTDQGILVTCIGDRRVVEVDGEPKLFALLEDGQTLQLGRLQASYHLK